MRNIYTYIRLCVIDDLHSSHRRTDDPSPFPRLILLYLYTDKVLHILWNIPTQV